MSFHYDNGVTVSYEILSIHAGETVWQWLAHPAREINVADVAGAYDPTSGGVWLNTTAGQQNIRDLKPTALRRRALA